MHGSRHKERGLSSFGLVDLRLGVACLLPGLAGGAGM